MNPFSTNPTKWSNTLKQFIGNSWRIVSVFDHFVGLVLKRKSYIKKMFHWYRNQSVDLLFKLIGWLLWAWVNMLQLSLTHFIPIIKKKPQPATLLWKKLQYKCFPVNFAKFSGTLFLENTSAWLLLDLPLYFNVFRYIVVLLLLQSIYWPFIPNNSDLVLEEKIENQIILITILEIYNWSFFSNKHKMIIRATF